MAICERCAKPTEQIIMSYFDVAMICPDCRSKESQHPDYKSAMAVDEAARYFRVYAGIG